MSTRAVFEVKVVEGGHIFGPSEAKKMKLPFNEGWEGWAVFQGDYMVMYSHDFQLVSNTCYALNNMEYQI